MKTYTIPKQKLYEFNKAIDFDFPKYTTQLINWANQNAQGTRPNVVGQMSELIKMFKDESDNLTIEGWRVWYDNKYPEAIDNATDKIYNQMEKLKEAIKLIDRDMIKNWVMDLIVNKTFVGLFVQESILAFLAEKFNKTYRLSLPQDEAKGIDGYIGEIAYSIKPITYKTMSRLQEKIDATMIYYEKVNNGLKIEIDDD